MRKPIQLRHFGLMILLAAVIGLVTIYAFSMPLVDFIEYWTAAHLLLVHQNPYSLPAMFHAQQLLGWKEPVPLMFLSPPWALPFILPLAFAKSYALAWLVWVTAMVCAVALSSWILMELYFDNVRLPEISDAWFYRCLFAFTFYPVLLCLKFAQTAPLLLLGVAGFLFFESKRRPVLAGALLCLTLIKPQLLYLVWLAVFLRSCQQRRWKVLVSSALAIILLTAFALRLDPRAWRHYWELARSPYAEVFLSGTVGFVRSALGSRNTYWLQFVPPVFGLAWFAVYWRKHRGNWNWTARMPALVTACLLTTPYGWLSDQTLLAVPIIAVAAIAAKEQGRLSPKLVLLYTALNVVLLLAAIRSTQWAFLPAPVLLALLLFRESRTDLKNCSRSVAG